MNEPDFKIGDRIMFDATARDHYDGIVRDGEWYVETIGGDTYFPTSVLDGAQCVARIREKRTGMWAHAPFDWIKRWVPKVGAVKADARPVSESLGVVLGMADPLADTPIRRHHELSFPIAPTEDEEITCFVCGANRATHEFDVRANGKRLSIGAHYECIVGIRHVRLESK